MKKKILSMLLSASIIATTVATQPLTSSAEGEDIKISLGGEYQTVVDKEFPVTISIESPHDDLKILNLAIEYDQEYLEITKLPIQGKDNNFPVFTPSGKVDVYPFNFNNTNAGGTTANGEFGILYFKVKDGTPVDTEADITMSFKSISRASASGNLVSTMNIAYEMATVKVINFTALDTVELDGDFLPVAGGDEVELKAKALADGARIEKNFTWALSEDGKTLDNANATITADGKLKVKAACQAATVDVYAIAAEGKEMGVAFPQKLTVNVFQPATGVDGVPENLTFGAETALPTTATPAYATNKTVVWSISENETDSSGFTLVDNKITVEKTEGTITLTATVALGKSPTEDFTKDFTFGIIADWEVSFVTDGAAAISPVTIAHNGTLGATLVTPEKAGYTFEGWFSDAAFTTPFTSSTPVTGPTTLYAKWEKIPAYPPSAPTQLKVLAGDDSAFVTWSAPTYDGDTPITAYKVSADGTTWVTLSEKTFSHTFTNLTGSSVYFYVRAVNMMGETEAKTEEAYSFTSTGSGSGSGSGTGSGSGSTSGYASGGGGGGGGSVGSGSTGGTVSRTVSAASAQKAASAAVKSATAAGSSKANVKFANVTTITKESIAAIAKACSDAGIKGSIIADTRTKDNKVDVRLTITADESAQNVNVYGSTSDANVKKVTARFNKFYSNVLQVVNLGQKGSFGQDVKVAFKTDIKDAKGLAVYLYDATTNKCSRIKTEVRIDKNGFLHVVVPAGGQIIISDGTLRK